MQQLNSMVQENVDENNNVSTKRVKQLNCMQANNVEQLSIFRENVRRNVIFIPLNVYIITHYEI